MTESRKKEARANSGTHGVLLMGLRAVRQEAGLTQRELAARAGTGQGTVSKLEILRRGAYPRTIRKLSAALGVAPAALVSGRHPE